MKPLTDPSDPLQLLIRLRSEENCSCVVRNGDCIRIYRERGVRDLFRLLHERPRELQGALIADKVVGKGAAALMILGRIEALFADVISIPALELLERARIATRYGIAVPRIINRQGTGPCPLESRCAACITAEECLPLIREFVEHRTRGTESESNQPTDSI